MDVWSKSNLQFLTNSFRMLFSRHFIKSDSAERLMAAIYKEIEYGDEDV